MVQQKSLVIKDLLVCDLLQNLFFKKTWSLREGADIQSQHPPLSFKAQKQFLLLFAAAEIWVPSQRSSPTVCPEYYPASSSRPEVHSGNVVI